MCIFTPQAFLTTSGLTYHPCLWLPVLHCSHTMSKSHHTLSSPSDPSLPDNHFQPHRDKNITRANQTFGNNFNQPCCKVSLCTVLSICTTCSQSFPCNTCLVIPTKQLIHLSTPINTPIIAKASENSSNPASSNYLHHVPKFGLFLDHIIPLIASFASPMIRASDKPNVFD